VREVATIIDNNSGRMRGSKRKEILMNANVARITKIVENGNLTNKEFLSTEGSE